MDRFRLGIVVVLGAFVLAGCQQKVEEITSDTPNVVPFEDTGHFIHIEHPRRVADLVLDFLG